MSIYDKLYSWQKRIVDKFYNRDSFGIYLDMGLGKTPISLALAEKNKCNRILVITINSKALEMIDNEGSWSFWSNNSVINPKKVLSKNSFKKQKDQTFLTKDEENNLLVYITNYEAIFSRRKDRKQTVELADDIKKFIKTCAGQNVAIIIDECHKMKDLQSMQTKAIMKIKKELMIKNVNSLYSYLLSGTPFTTGYIDLYSQLKFLGYDKNKSEFVDDYCVRGNIPGLLGWQQPIIGYKNINKLYEVIHKYALTIKSEDVIDLPEKTFVYHKLLKSTEIDLYTKERINGKILKEYLIKKDFNKDVIDNYKNEDIKYQNPFYRNIDFPSINWIADTTGTLWLRARELSIGFQGNADKYKWYHKTRIEMLKEFLENNPDNYLIFYNYTPELFEIFNICETLNYKIDIYCGEIKSLNNYNTYNRQSIDDKINNKKNVIIANFMSGSTGMNWQAYNKCIIFSLPLYKDYEQGIKRIHRIGQKETTIYHIFYEDNWLDNSMLKALNEQIDYSEKMFESDFKKQSILEG